MKTEIKILDEKIFVECPYIAWMPKHLRAMGGTWDGTYWVFSEDADTLRGLKDLLRATFGYNQDSRKATVKLKAKNSLSTGKVAYVVGGFILSSARGRDSGAKVGDGVKLIDGSIYSGGSVKNWYSGIDGGTVFKIKNFPLDEMHRYEEDFEFEVVSEDSVELAAIKVMLGQLEILDKGGVDTKKLREVLEEIVI